MFICIEENIGSIVSSDSLLKNSKYILCDGRTVKRSDYPKLFDNLGYQREQLKLPDYSTILEGIYFYVIACD